MKGKQLVLCSCVVQALTKTTDRNRAGIWPCKNFVAAGHVAGAEERQQMLANIVNGLTKSALTIELAGHSQLACTSDGDGPS